MMVKCKKCKCDIFSKYESLEGKSKKYIFKLEQIPSNDCNTSIYLESVSIK